MFKKRILFQMATDQFIFGKIRNMYKWKDKAHLLAYVLRIHNRFDEILLMYFMHFCALWFPRFLVHNLKNTNNNEKKKKYNNTMTKSVAHYLRKFYLFFQIKKLSLLFALFLREKLVFCVKFIIWKVSWKIWRFSAWGFLLTVENDQTIPNIFKGVLDNVVLKNVCLWQNW